MPFSIVKCDFFYTSVKCVFPGKKYSYLVKHAVALSLYTNALFSGVKYGKSRSLARKPDKHL